LISGNCATVRTTQQPVNSKEQKMSAASATQNTTAWKIDSAHSSVEFSVRHMKIATVRGHFGAVNGTVTIDENDPSASTVEVSIPTATVDTRQEQRDAHLRSPDFFDTEKYPEMTFRSTRVERNGDAYKVTGDLTIRGVTREVTLDVTDEGRGKGMEGEARAAFRAVTKVDRREFGLTWNQALEAGGFLVDNDIRITIDVSLQPAE
jgi:polyisoprenoid-binding protein YceI